MLTLESMVTRNLLRKGEPVANKEESVFKNTKHGYQDAHFDTNAFSKPGHLVGGGSPANAHQVGNHVRAGGLRLSGHKGAHQIGKK